jgi:hypothetical protein
MEAAGLVCLVVLFEGVEAFLECGMGGEPSEKGVVACPFAEAAEEGDHRFEADAAGDARAELMPRQRQLLLARF